MNKNKFSLTHTLLMKISLLPTRNEGGGGLEEGGVGADILEQFGRENIKCSTKYFLNLLISYFVYTIFGEIIKP